MEITPDHIAVISHQKSGWNLKNIDKMRDACTQTGVLHFEIKAIGDLDPVLEKLGDQGIKILCVNAGDGTLDAVIAAMRSLQYFKEEPVIVPLPGGTTNMTHRSLGFKKRSDKILRRIVLRTSGQDKAQISVQEKKPLKLMLEDAPYPLYGFFLATGAIPRAIAMTRKKYHAKGFKNKLSEVLAIGQLVGRLMTSKTEEDQILKASNLQYSFDNWTWNWFDSIFCYVTTLDTLLAGIKPNPPQDGFVISGLNNPYNFLPFSLPRIWRGRSDKNSLGGVFSTQVYEDLHMKVDSAWTIDGEIFAPDEGKAFTELLVKADKPVRFYKL